MNAKDIKRIEKTIAILKNIPKEKRYILIRPETFKEIDLNGGFEVCSDGYISAWDINGGKHWFDPKEFCTLEEVEKKIKSNHKTFIKSSIKSKQFEIRNIEKDILQLKKELRQ